LRLFVGGDWSQEHHDVELMDSCGRRLAKARLPEGVAGMAWLHAMIGARLGDTEDEDAQVLVGIETDRGRWVAALVAAGYTVLAVNPLQAARFGDRLGVSGATSDAADAHVLADMDRHPRRRAAPGRRGQRPGRSAGGGDPHPQDPATIPAAPRAQHLGQPEVVAAAYAASIQALIAVLNVLNTQVKTLQGQVEAHFGRHPAAEILAS
jgi:transposase